MSSRAAILPVSVRARRFGARAAERIEAGMPEPAAENGDVDRRHQLRLAAAIALAAAVVLLPVQAFGASRAAFPALLLIYAIHAALSLSVLLASFTEVGTRHADRLSLVFVLGLTVNLLLYLYLLPYAVPTYPSLISNALTCLLIAGAVLFMWDTRRMVLVGLFMCIGFALTGVSLTLRGLSAAPFGLTLCWLGVGAALAVACARTLNRLRASLLRRQDELAGLSARLISVQEEQLRQLSRELHDELGQSLTAVSSYLWLVEQRLPEQLTDLRTQAGQARRLVSQTLGEMRELSQLLRPPGLEVYGLAPSLETHVKAFGERQQIATVFTTDGVPEHMPAELEIAVYRITQEALTNVARHARAKRVRVALTATGGELRLDIQDDGVGLRASQGTRPGIGLVGIRERVRALGGTVSITSASGVRLVVRLPFSREGSPPS
jgi:signal transduction histidine kinase